MEPVSRRDSRKEVLTMRRHYSRQTKERIVFYVLIVVLALAAGIAIGMNTGRAAENELVKCWAMCKPGSQVNVRHTPGKTGEIVGYLDAGDWFLTDGDSKNGYIRCYNIGEYGEGWVYSGYVVTEEPEKVFADYVCVANRRVACRKWIGGEMTGNPWLVNGSSVAVFYIADGWAVTARGYIMAEWLEKDLR